MPHPNTPLADPSNPCYCPAEPASAFLDRLRAHHDGNNSDQYIPTFSLLLERMAAGGGEDSFVDERRGDEGGGTRQASAFGKSANWLEQSDSFAWRAQQRSAPTAAVNPFDSYASGEEEDESASDEASTLSSSSSANVFDSASSSSFSDFAPSNLLARLKRLPQSSLIRHRQHDQQQEPDTTFGALQHATCGRSSLAPNESSFELPAKKVRAGDYARRTGHSPGPSSDVYAHAAFIRGGWAAGAGGVGLRRRSSVAGSGSYHRTGTGESRGFKRRASDDDGRRKAAAKIRRLEGGFRRV
jgi:hypothetical protein